jgi:NAD(P)-dependent dehydrogenase (short-subunit alcohol dehydrogenase family)
VRVLLVGGGCRGLELTRALAADGHAVRVVTRSEERRAEIEVAGGECWIGDPDRIGTLRYALANVTILLWALGTATGDDAADLHGSRLEMMLERTVDTMVRGVVYEAAGTLPGEVLCAGAGIVNRMCQLNEVPHALLDADPADGAAWAAAAGTAIDALLTAKRPSVR